MYKYLVQIIFLRWIPSNYQHAMNFIDFSFAYEKVNILTRSLLTIFSCFLKVHFIRKTFCLTTISKMWEFCKKIIF